MLASRGSGEVKRVGGPFQYDDMSEDGDEWDRREAHPGGGRKSQVKDFFGLSAISDAHIIDRHLEFMKNLLRIMIEHLESI